MAMAVGPHTFTCSSSPEKALTLAIRGTIFARSLWLRSEAFFSSRAATGPTPASIPWMDASNSCSS